MTTIQDSIGRLVFFDHEEDTDVASQLTDLVVLARTEKWTTDELVDELAAFYRAIYSTLTSEEQLSVLSEVVNELPFHFEA